METYGIDWRAFEEPATLEYHLRENNLTEDTTSWLGLAGAPPADRMAEIVVPEPSCALDNGQVSLLFEEVVLHASPSTMDERRDLWGEALVFARQLSRDF